MGALAIASNVNDSADLTGVNIDFDFAAGTVTVAAGVTLTLTAAQADGVSFVGAGGVTITGSDGQQSLNVQTTGANIVEGGAGADTFTLGSGIDTVVFAGGSFTDAVASVSTATVTDPPGDSSVSVSSFTINIGTGAGIQTLTATGPSVEGAQNYVDLAAAINASDSFSDTGVTVVAIDLNGDVTSNNSSSQAFELRITDPQGRGIDEASLIVLDGTGNEDAVAIAFQVSAGSVIITTPADSTLASPDYIINFTVGTDKIDLSGIAGLSLLEDGARGELQTNLDSQTFFNIAEAFEFVASRIDDEVPGATATWFEFSGNTYIYAQSTGAELFNENDLFIQLTGVVGLTNNDISLALMG